MEKENGEKFTVYEVPREIFIIEPPLELVTHSMQEVYRQCKQPYYKHEDGCPNFNSKATCPPNFGLKNLDSKSKVERKKHITEKYDIDSLHLLVLKFNFDIYIQGRRKDHPTWTNRALANQRHWQGHLRSQTIKYWEEVLANEYVEYDLEINPEGRGVNIVETLANHGIDVIWCKEDKETHEFISLSEYVYYPVVFGRAI